MASLIGQALAVRNKGGPPVPMSGRAARRGMMFDLGAGQGNRQAYLRAYGRSGTVFSIVSLLQQAAAAGTWHLYKKQPADGRRRYAPGDQGSDQRREVVQHAALKLWRKPNEFHTGFEFREGSNQHLELTGETFWVLNREVATFPTAMWYVRPDRMEPVPDPDDYLVGWLYSGPGGEQVPLKLDEVILEKLPDPLDPFRGAGPVASILDNIQQQDYATQYQRNLFLNGADPGGIITVPSKMSDRDFDELTERWREMHQGIARAGRVGLLENGATWSTEGQSNKDLEYGNLRLANRDEIREAWRMHKAMLGTSDDVNRANSETAAEVFGSQQTVPRLERRRDTLNRKLLPMFGDDTVEFDFEDPRAENREEVNAELIAKSAAAQTLISAGFDAAAVLEVVGLPDMPWTAPAQMPQPDEQTDINPGRGLSNQARGGFLNGREVIRVGEYTGCNSGTGMPPQAAKGAAEKVFQQVAEDYPADAIGWMHHADWLGPVFVPLDHIDPMMKWMDGVDPVHVQDFVQRRQSGKKLKPAILVKRPSHHKLLLVDGHHRYAAECELNEPLRAYVATVAADHGPWEQMHDRQYPRLPGHEGGGDAKNQLMPFGDAEQMAATLRRILGDGYVPVELEGALDASRS